MPTLTFTKVFTAQGSKNGRDWTRWDYRDAAGEKYSTFKELDIPLNVPVKVELEIQTSGDYVNKSISAYLGPETSEGQKETGSTPEGVRTAPVASEGDARGRTRAIIAAQMAPALFNSLETDEQSFAAAVQIMDKLVEYAFQS